MKPFVVLLQVVLFLLTFYDLANAQETPKEVEVSGINSKNVTIPCGIAESFPFSWYKDGLSNQVLHNDRKDPDITAFPDKYSSDGSGLVIHNLDRVADQGTYACSVHKKAKTISFKLVIYEPPTGIELQRLGSEGTATFVCSTVGGSKPPVDISFDWVDQHGMRRDLPSVQKSSKSIGEEDFCSTDLRVTLELGAENALDTIGCTAVNSRTDTVFKKETKLLAPSLVHGTRQKFWFDEEISSIEYTSQVEMDNDEVGLVIMKLDPIKPIYYINETVDIMIEQPNGEIFPFLEFKWYTETEKDTIRVQHPDNGGRFNYIARENSTVHCFISNLLGKAMISVDINVKEGSSYMDLNQVSTGSTSTAVLIGVIVGCLFLIIIVIIVGMFVKRKAAQKKMDRKYDVRKNTQEHNRDLEMQSTGNENQIADEKDLPQKVNSYTKPDTAIAVETESLMKSAVSHDDKIGGSGRNAFKYEPQSSCEMTSRDGYSTGDDRSHGGYHGVGDDVSMRSGSTICIDDETFPLPPEDDDEAYYVNDPRRSFVDSQHLSSTD